MPSANDKPEPAEEPIHNRLVRIETRIVKIMEALDLDPRTGMRLVPTRHRYPRFRNPPEDKNE